VVSEVRSYVWWLPVLSASVVSVPGSRVWPTRITRGRGCRRTGSSRERDGLVLLPCRILSTDVPAWCTRRYRGSARSPWWKLHARRGPRPPVRVRSSRRRIPSAKLAFLGSRRFDYEHRLARAAGSWLGTDAVKGQLAARTRLDTDGGHSVYLSVRLGHKRPAQGAYHHPHRGR
jgi:hypothetical protein